jgi:hypothetical protein
MSSDLMLEMFELLRKVDREQGIVLERISNVQDNVNKLDARVTKLEERTQGLAWLRQTKNAILWVAAILGGISATLSIRKFF